MAVVDVPVGELIIVRFSPFAATRLAESAQDEFDRLQQDGKPPIYSISVFGLVKTDETSTLDGLADQICHAKRPKGKKVCVTTRTALESQGFVVQLSEPPQYHYDVVLGTELRKGDTERLEELLESGRRSNPAWEK